MFFKTKILEWLIKDKIRYFKSRILSGQLHNLTQYSSGGDDYCPLKESEALGGMINNNPAHRFVFAWRDQTEKISAPGEKRIYSVNETGEVVAAVHLKNDGSVNISGSGITINVDGSATDMCTSGQPSTGCPCGTITINAAAVNLGAEGGAFVLTENSEIKDGEGRPCTITSNTTKTKAV